MSIQVKVFPDKCICIGRCVETAPDVFAQSEEDGTVILLNEFPDNAQKDAVETATHLCPVLAIELAIKVEPE